MVKCPLCGVENPEGSRFCGSCGEPLKGIGKDSMKFQISELRKNLKPEGRTRCTFCHKVANIYFGRCGYCGELIGSATGDIGTSTSLEAKVDEIVASTLESMEAEGIDLVDIREDLITALRQRAEELIKSRLKSVGNEIKDENIERIAEDVGNIIANEATTITSSKEIKPSVAISQKDIDIRKRLDMHKECFICLGTIGPNDPQVVCTCGMYYHRTCANDVGYCPNCGKRFT